MSTHTLRELAKFGSGLIAADLLSVIAFKSAGFFPLTILGVTWSSESIVPIMVFDVALLIMLVHFGWRVKLPIETPRERSLLLIIGTVFLIVALVHLIRIAFGLPLILGAFDVPVWLSWVGVIVTGYLSYTSFHFARKR